MSYEQKNEIKTVQPTPKALEYFVSMPPQIWVAGILLGLIAFGAINVPVGIGIGIAAFLFLRNLSERQALEQAKARASAFANCIGPVMVCSTSPDEGVEAIRERALAWRESLKLSGNPYWNLIPIIEFPYSPMLFETAQLSAGWNIYLHLADSKRHTENMRWYEVKCPQDLKALFANAVLPAPKQDV